MSEMISMLSNVGVATIGGAKQFDASPGAQIFVYSTAGSSATVLIQGAPTATGPWHTLATISNPSATAEVWQGTAFPWLRANCTVWSSGAIYAVGHSLATDPGPWAASVASASSTSLTHGIIKRTITLAEITAKGEVLSGDFLVGSLPANSRLVASYINTTADTSANACTISMGVTGAGYIDWIVASDFKATARYGDAVAERGATHVDGALFYTAAQDIYAQIVKTTIHLNDMTAAAATCYVEYVTYP